MTEWSPSSHLEIALLAPTDWGASMITVDPWPLSSEGSARPLCFRRTFDVASIIRRARLYITSYGVYDACINGRKVGNHCLAPGFQSYSKRLHYQVYDVKDYLEKGANVIEVEVAAGWFASAWSWAERRFVYGKKLGVLAQLEIDGCIISTDKSWNVSTTALVSSEIYNGEICDLRSKPKHFACEELPLFAKLICPEAPPVKVIERIEPKQTSNVRSGVIVLDFGQNMTGRISIRNIQKPPGWTITIRHAEILQGDQIEVRPLRTARAKDILICDGSKIREWHPKHTFHGFRYVEITGLDAACLEGCVVADVMHTDMARTGWFSCSNDDVNRLHENSVWSMKSNFVSVPMECPSRDERYGWTGDLNIFAPTATFLHDTAGMLKEWLEDLYLDQMDSSFWKQGVVPLFVPNCLPKGHDGLHGWDPMPNGVWGDAAIMVPWVLYHTTGDVTFLSRQYDSMIQYLEKGVVRGADGLWDPQQWQFGDWLDPRAPPNDSGRGTTDGTFVADCFLVESTRIVRRVAKLLNKPTDVGYTTEQLLESWRNKYLTAAGFVAPDTATALSLALTFNLVPDSARSQSASRLSRIARLNDFKITTGFVGTAFLARALTDTGNDEVAYAMLYEKKCPSYLYPVSMGATTTWERWDSLLPDGTVNAGSMTSFNHHALGSVSHWLHADVGGLQALEPGWKVFRVRPKPNRELTWAEVRFESRYGLIELRWTLTGDEFSLALTIPPNSSAIVCLPNGVEKQDVGSGRYTFNCRFVQLWPPKAILPPWGRAEF